MESGTAPKTSGYDNLQENAALFHEKGRQVLVIRGPDRRDFLQRLLTQDIEGLGAGSASEAVILDKEGKIQAIFLVCALKDCFLLRVEEGRADVLQALLEKYKVASKITIHSLASPWACLSIGGPQALEIVQKYYPRLKPKSANPCVWSMDSSGVLPPESSDGNGFVLRWDRMGFPAYEIWTRRSTDSDPKKEVFGAGLSKASSKALAAHRIENLWPLMPQEGKRGLIPNEVPQLNAWVSFEKGCFPGQEVVVRIQHRGHPGRRLVLLGFQAEKSPPPGGLQTPEGQPAGDLVLSAYCPGLESYGAMAMVRHEFHEPGTVLQIIPGQVRAKVLK